jgi:hypothetical protein
MTSKIDEHLGQAKGRNKGKRQITNIRNDGKDIITDCADIKRIKRTISSSTPINLIN